MCHVISSFAPEGVQRPGDGVRQRRPFRPDGIRGSLPQAVEDVCGPAVLRVCFAELFDARILFTTITERIPELRGYCVDILSANEIETG